MSSIILNILHLMKTLKLFLCAIYAIHVKIVAMIGEFVSGFISDGLHLGISVYRNSIM